MFKELEFTTSLWDLKPCFTKSTRYGTINDRVVESCIDNIFTNSQVVQESRILDWNFSDHMVISVKRKKLFEPAKKVSIVGRSYKNYDREDFPNLVIRDNRQSFYDSADPAECWEIMEEKIRLHLNSMCPQKTFRVKEVDEPWVTNEILEEIKDKDRAMKKAKRTGLSADFKEARAMRNRIGRMIEQVKADFLKEQLEELAGDPKKFWRLIKTIMPNKKVKSKSISLKDDDTGLDIEDSKVSDYINNFFTSIGPKLAKDHNRAWELAGEETDEQCPPLQTDYHEVLKLCKGIRDFPGNTTFREKGAKLDCADKLGVFLSLTLCIKANFDPLQRIKYDDIEKM